MHSTLRHKEIGSDAIILDSRIGDLLLGQGRLTVDDAERISRLQRQEGIRFGEAAKLLGLVTDADIDTVLAQQFDYHYLPCGSADFAPQLIAAYSPFSREVEALRAVRGQLLHRWFSVGNQSLLFASAGRYEGVSIGIANLAIVFSQLGQRTLLIDANLRNPAQHKIFNIDLRCGLSDVLVGRISSDAHVNIDPFPNLSVLIAGTTPPNPQELLSRPSFGNLLASVSPQFDVILIDVGSFSVSADVLAIASHVKGIAIIARAGHASVADLKEIAALVRNTRCELVGSVLFDF